MHNRAFINHFGDSLMHPQATLAIKAAKGFRTWGAYAARIFCKKNNIPSKLVRIARQLEAATKEGF
jgi:hypothetical protein